MTTSTRHLNSEVTTLLRYTNLFIINIIKCHTKVVPSVLWHCWLGGRKGIRSEKNEWWGAGVVVCLEWGADLHTAQLMPLPLMSLASAKSRLVFAFLVPAHPGSPRQRAFKRVCVCATGKLIASITINWSNYIIYPTRPERMSQPFHTAGHRQYKQEQHRWVSRQLLLLCDMATSN